MSTILVTGGAGYIGSHACKALARAGYLPVCYDNLERGHEWSVKWGPLEQGDILDSKRLDEVMQKYRPEAVMHFAAYISVGESVTQPDLYYRNNVAGSKNLLDSMARNGINKIIFSSSAAVYGEPEFVPLTETHPQKPVSPYGRNKQEVEKLLEEYADSQQIHSVAFRYFNAAGADPENETGESHDPETHLIPLLLMAVKHATPIRVYGTDYDTPDGTCIRDYIHVTDIISAHLQALQLLDKKPGYSAYNLGTGNGKTVLQVIKAVEEVTGKEVRVENHPRREGDSSVLVCNVDRIKKDINWQPEHSDLHTIISTAWNWFGKCNN